MSSARSSQPGPALDFDGYAGSRYLRRAVGDAPNHGPDRQGNPHHPEKGSLDPVSGPRCTLTAGM